MRKKLIWRISDEETTTMVTVATILGLSSPLEDLPRSPLHLVTTQETTWTTTTTT
jgi:hypothetical protein